MKRFRFSLLSLLVGVLLAGGVGWMNMRPTVAEIPNGDVWRYYGWPYHTYTECTPASGATFHIWGGRIRRRMGNHIGSRWGALAADIAIGLAIVVGGTGACEWLVRRRAKAKE